MKTDTGRRGLGGCAALVVAAVLASSCTGLSGNQTAHTAPAHTAVDIEYGRAAGQPLLLDAHVPSGAGPFPVAIIVHGGGWRGGDKGGTDRPGSSADITPLLQTFTEAKFTWFSINYRLAPEHRWPSQVEDVITAVRWARENGHKYKANANCIVLVGHSAGGQMVAMAPMVADQRLPVRAVVGLAPVTDFEQELPRLGGNLGVAQQALLNRPAQMTPESLEMLRAMSPINKVRAGLPPFLLVHGDADRSVPLVQSTAFQTKLQSHGARADLMVLPGAPHAITEWKTFAPDYDKDMVSWLRKVLADC